MKNAAARPCKEQSRLAVLAPRCGVLLASLALLISCKRSDQSGNQEDIPKAAKPAALVQPGAEDELLRHGMTEADFDSAKSRIKPALLPYFTAKNFSLSLESAAKHPKVISGEMALIDRAVDDFNEAMTLFRQNVEEAKRRTVEIDREKLDQWIEKNGQSAARAWAFLATGDPGFEGLGFDLSDSLSVYAALAQVGPDAAQIEKVLIRALEVNPENSWAALKLALHYAAVDDTSSALRLLQSVGKMPRGPEPSRISRKMELNYLAFTNLENAGSKAVNMINAVEKSDFGMYSEASGILKRHIDGQIAANDFEGAVATVTIALKFVQTLEQSPSVEDRGFSVIHFKDLLSSYPEYIAPDTVGASLAEWREHVDGIHAENLQLLEIRSTMEAQSKQVPANPDVEAYLKLKSEIGEYEALKRLLTEPQGK